MKKLLFVAIAMLGFVGCASKGDLNALSARVDALEATDKAQNADITQLKSDHEALKGDISDLGAKLDRAFVKKQAK